MVPLLEIVTGPIDGDRRATGIEHRESSDGLQFAAVGDLHPAVARVNRSRGSGKSHPCIAGDRDVETVSRMRHTSSLARDEILSGGRERDGLGRRARQHRVELDRIRAKAGRLHVRHIVGNGLKSLFECDLSRQADIEC